MRLRGSGPTAAGSSQRERRVPDFPDRVPYLKSVRDPYDRVSPLHRWRRRLSDGEMEARLSGLFSGRLRDVKVTRRGAPPRIVLARVVGSRGATNATGQTLRERLGLRSTRARFRHR